jgi:hypothetical protein
MAGLSVGGSGSVSSSASSAAKQASGAVSGAAPNNGAGTTAAAKTVTSQSKAGWVLIALVAVGLLAAVSAAFRRQHDA